MSKIIFVIFCCAIINSVFGYFQWSIEYPVVIDTCMNNSGSSVIYRCTSDSIWEYVYSTSLVCSGVADYVTTWGGCDDTYMYRVENCSTAQTNAKLGGSSGCKYFVSGSDSSSMQSYALDICYNSGTSASSIYTCINGSPYRYTYNTADCSGSVTGNSSQANNGNYNCGGTYDCHADVKRFSKQGSYTSYEYCNYDTSNYLPPSTSTCNYIVKGDGSKPIAIGTCYSSRHGNYKYSTKYMCDMSTGEYQVVEYQWLNNDDCSGTNYKYLVSNYTNDNYTISCGHSDCGTIVREYDNCVSSLDTHRQTYDEYVIALDQCIRYYNMPTDSSTVQTTTPYEDQYYMYSCIDGYLGVYYFLDDKCTDINTFYVENTSTATCPTIVDGCTTGTSNSQMFNFIHSIIIIFAILVVQLLF